MNLQRGVRARILFGIAANALGRFWVLLLQLLAVPVLTWKWGAHGYGLWLMITAVPSYIAMSDFGFGTAAAADMTQSVAMGDRLSAVNVFQSTWTLLVLVLSVVVVVALGAWLFVPPLSRFLDVSQSESPRLSAALLALLIYSIFSVQMNVISAGYRCTQNYALGTLLQEGLLPIEGLTLIVVVLLGGGIFPAAASMAVIRVTGCVIYYLILRRSNPWLYLGIGHSSFTEIRRLAAPALSALGVTLSLALSLQGVILALGFFGGPAVAGLFGAARTIARAPLQLVTLFSRATLPEMGIAFARRDAHMITRLVALNVAALAAVAAPAAVVLALWGQSMLKLLSHRSLSAPPWLFTLLAVSLVLQAGWNAVSQILFATNKQQRIAAPYAILALLTVLSPAVTQRSNALLAVSLTGCVADGLMLVLVGAISWSEIVVLLTAEALPDVGSLKRFVARVRGL